MKTQPFHQVAFAILVMVITEPLGRGGVLLSEDFEAGLGRWTGKNNGATSGILVPDPLASGRGNVLTFTALTNGGDIFTTVAFSNAHDIRISFDYLGLARAGSTPGNLGGFLGISPALPGTTDIWLAGTQDNFPGLQVALSDDGFWHHYACALDAGTGYASFHLMMEDYQLPAGGAVPRDAYFDNIEVSALPELRCTIQSGIPCIRIDGRTDSTYAIEGADDLPTTNWTTLTNIVLTSSPALWMDFTATNSSTRFYRATRLP